LIGGVEISVDGFIKYLPKFGVFSLSSTDNTLKLATLNPAKPNNWGFSVRSKGQVLTLDSKLPALDLG
jgi:hypothetical protein